MRSKIIEQRQGKYRRYLVHVPDIIVKAAKFSPLYFEWVLADKTTVEVWTHSRKPPLPMTTRVYQVAGKKGRVYYRSTVPTHLVDLMGLRDRSVEWSQKSERVFTLTLVGVTE